MEIVIDTIFFFFFRFSLGDARRPLHETAVLVEDVVHTQLVNLVRAYIILLGFFSPHSAFISIATHFYKIFFLLLEFVSALVR
jgi:hypothetical protein